MEDVWQTCTSVLNVKMAVGREGVGFHWNFTSGGSGRGGEGGISWWQPSGNFRSGVGQNGEGVGFFIGHGQGQGRMLEVVGVGSW